MMDKWDGQVHQVWTGSEVYLDVMVWTESPVVMVPLVGPVPLDLPGVEGVGVSSAVGMETLMGVGPVPGAPQALRVPLVSQGYGVRLENPGFVDPLDPLGKQERKERGDMTVTPVSLGGEESQECLVSLVSQVPQVCLDCPAPRENLVCQAMQYLQSQEFQDVQAETVSLESGAPQVPLEFPVCQAPRAPPARGLVRVPSLLGLVTA